jgi:uncharacterized protein (DUF58 family)
MTPPTSGGRPLIWRTVNAAIIGLGAGSGAVVVVRAVLGPTVVVAGALIGLAAMMTGAIASWVVFAHRSARGRAARFGADRPLRGRVHPKAWFGPVIGSIFAVLAWAAVAHSSGSGWVQAIGAVLAAALLTGMIAPAFAVRGASASCLSCPPDARVGRTVEVTFEASGPIRIVPRVPPGPEVRASGSPRGRRTAVVVFTPANRGVLEHLVVELASSAPFGLLWWAREMEVALPRPIHVAPRIGQPGPLETVPESSVGDAPLKIPSGIGEPRSVRPYHSGDTRRSIHWPATSHVGSLMVREKERETDNPIVFELRLPADPSAAETECERVMGSLAQALMQGRPIVLGTREADGRVVRVVRDRIDLGRRLARAVASPGNDTDRTREPV